MPTVQQNPAKYEAVQWTAESEINDDFPFLAAMVAIDIPLSSWAKDASGNLCDASSMSIAVPAGTWFVSNPYWESFPGWVIQRDPSQAPELNQIWRGPDLVGDDTKQFTVVV